MTIPRLGNSGSSMGKIQIVSSPVPDAIENLPPVSESVQIPQEVASGGVPDASVQVEDSTEKNPVQDTEQKVNKPNSKEYSIEQFRHDYEDMVVNRILPELHEYEGERKKRLTGAIIAGVVFGLAALYVFFFVDGKGSGDLFAALVALAGGTWFWLKKSFENKVKKKVLPILMRAIPGFYWQQTQTVKNEEIIASNIIGRADKAAVTFDDCFIGDYRGVPVAISECEFQIGGGRNAETIFEGVIIRIKMNKNFEGKTVVRAKKAYNKDKKDLVKKIKLNDVHLEDTEFEKNYMVFANDQIESRYLLTTAFMERLKNIKLAFNAKHISCSFYGDSVYIAPHTGKDLFSLCSLVKPVDNHEQFTVLFNEFVSILELVDHFKLDKELGL